MMLEEGLVDTLNCQKDEQVCPSVKMLRQRLSDFGHIMRWHDCREKVTMLGKLKGSSKRGKNKYEMDRLPKGKHGLEFTRAEPSSCGQGILKIAYS